MTEAIPQWIVDVLIEAGRSPNIDGENASEALVSLREYNYINRLHWRDWNAVADQLSLDDLVSVAKALTIADGQSHWCGGSVSAVIWVFHRIIDRNIEAADTLLDWIRPRTHNDFVPFGTQRAKTVAEYILLPFRDGPSRTSSQYSEAELAALDDQRRIAIADAEAHQADQQRIRSTERNAHLKELEQLESDERLRRIANDDSHNVEYYPSSWALVNERTLHLLTPDLRTALLHRIGSRRRGPWAALRRILLEVDK